jgi:predicted secreted protein
LRSAFLTALDAGDASKAFAIAQEIRRQEVEDEKVNNAHYQKLNEIYTDCKAKAEAAISDVREKAKAAAPL